MAMRISEHYAWIPEKKQRKNSPLLPKSLRAVIIGKSGCGKTTLLINLILRREWLDYNRLNVFGKSLHQPEYKILKYGFEKGLSKEQLSLIFQEQETLRKKYSPYEIMDAMAEDNDNNNNNNNDPPDTIKANFYTDCGNIPDPSELNEYENNLLILDDCILEKQNKAEAYYTRGRHNNCDTIYISQNYFRLPRQTIRENANFFILFPQDFKNITHIYADHCTDITIKEFKKFCYKTWENGKHNFVTIDLTSSLTNGKYRKNLDSFYFPEESGEV